MSSAARAKARHPERFGHQRVVVAWIHPGHLDAMFADSLLGFMDWDVEHGQHLRGGGGRIGLYSSPRIAEARSQVVDAFLTRPEFERAEWLWMLDTDMTFAPDTLDRLLASADSVSRPIVGGLCFAGSWLGRIYPTVYRLERGEKGISIDVTEDYPRDALVKVGATGAACLLVHRRVFKRLAEPYPKGLGTRPDGTPNPYPWFCEGGVDAEGRPYGEDIAFCVNAQACGFPIHVDTRVKVGHVKSGPLGEEHYDARREP